MTPLPAKRRSRSGKTMLLVLGAILAAVGLAILIFFGRTVLQAARAGDWVSTPCTIDSTVVKVSRSSKGRVSRNLQADYSWQWEGQTYHSDRYSFTSNTVAESDDVAFDLRHAARIPNGYRCLVNPQNPGEAVLSRDVPWFLVLILTPLAAMFPVVGLGMMFSNGGARQRREAAARASSPTEPLQWREDWSQGRVEEKSMWFSPGGRLFPVWIILVMAAFLPGLFVTASWTIWRQIAVVIMGGALLATIVATLLKARSAARFGRLEFVPDALPLCPGQPLAGHVPLRNPLRRTQGVKSEIRVTRAVRTRRGVRSEKVVTIPVQVQAEPLAIFLTVTLPQAPPFYPVDSSATATWTLVVKAPGNGLNATFELPVQAYY